MRQVKGDIAISAEKKWHLSELKDLIFERLHFMRIYLKEPRKEADVRVPLIIFSGATIGDVCTKLHRDFQNQFKFARVWGTSAKFPGQRLMLGHVLQDKDVVEVHLR